MTYAYVAETQRVGDFIVQVVSDDDSSYANPRDNTNLSVIYGEHPRYVIADGKPPFDEEDALNRGGIRLLERYLRMCKGMVAMGKLVIYDHGGVSYSLIPVDTRNPREWDTSVLGYAYVTKDAIERTGAPIEDAYRQMEEEVKEYSAWANGEVYGWVITKPCDHADEHDTAESVAACPHAEEVDSGWSYLGDTAEALADGISTAEGLLTVV